MPRYDRASFSSTFRYEYVSAKSGIAFSVGAGVFGQSIIIPHNLGYYPYYKLWYTFGGKVFRLFAGPSTYNLDGNGAQIFSISNTTSAITISMDNNGASTISGTIYYRIYAEPQV